MQKSAALNSTDQTNAQPPPGQTSAQPSPVGVLLVNLGTPDAPTPPAVRRYLKEFLWDPRVVDLPRLPWWLLLHGVILNTRPRRGARRYARIWTAEGSPLLAISRRLASALGERLRGEFGEAVRVELGMRYGNPPLAGALESLDRAGCRRLLVLPLYPQYGSATTGSTFDAIAGIFASRRRVPALRMIDDYHDDPGYVGALAASVRELWQREGPADRLVFSFHGVPKRWVKAGEPYADQCQATARLVADALTLKPDQWTVAYQSRFGPGAWLQPYTGALLASLARKGARRVDVLCPGFAADCLETLDEIGRDGRERFLAAGGERFRYIPALNDRPDHVAALAALVRRNLRGWLPGESPEGERPEANEAARDHA